MKRKTLCLDAQHGGLKMISAKDQQQVYSIKWISKVAIDNKCQNAYLANLFLAKLGGIPYITKSYLSNPESIFDTWVDNC